MYWYIKKGTDGYASIWFGARLSGGTAFEAQQSPLSTINHSFCSSMNTSTTDVEDVWRSKDKIAGEAVESPSNQDCEIHIYSSQKFTSNFANRYNWEVFFPS